MGSGAGNQDQARSTPEHGVCLRVWFIYPVFIHPLEKTGFSSPTQ